MERLLERDNLHRALRQVKRNKESAGVDGMTVDDLTTFVKQHWSRIATQLLAGNYRPQPVRQVEIPKPKGGVRKLGISTVLDRLIQQALLRVLQGGRSFSHSSYGFRPGRSAYQAIQQAQTHINEGYCWTLDMDLENFFDRVLKLINSYLKAGALVGDVWAPASEATPKGGPLSPLLANLLLDELDKELERRGHRFVRYTDDCNIYVKSQRSGQIRYRVRKITRRTRGRTMQAMIDELAVNLRGWKDYYDFAQMKAPIQDLGKWVRRKLRCYHLKQWGGPVTASCASAG